MALMPMSYMNNEMSVKRNVNTWQDSSFKQENLNLYSSEAEIRAN
jgi:hypothetical protein